MENTFNVVKLPYLCMYSNIDIIQVYIYFCTAIHCIYYDPINIHFNFFQLAIQHNAHTFRAVSVLCTPVAEIYINITSLRIIFSHLHILCSQSRKRRVNSFIRTEQRAETAYIHIIDICIFHLVGVGHKFKLFSNIICYTLLILEGLSDQIYLFLCYSQSLTLPLPITVSLASYRCLGFTERVCTSCVSMYIFQYELFHIIHSFG